MKPQAGFTYLGVLLALALIGLGLVVASEVWVTTARRQNIEQLRWVGEQYVQAIGNYYESSPGRVKTYPRTMNDLLEDKRYVTMRRHLRKTYANPLTGKHDWEYIRASDGGIAGVRVPVGELTVQANAPQQFRYSPAALLPLMPLRVQR